MTITTDQLCAIEECDKPAGSRGWCEKHYTRWLRHGDPLYTKRLLGASVEDRFWSHVQCTERCWEWQGSVDRKGYGRFNAGAGRYMLAHRMAWELTRGSVPAELALCHHCDNPRCVRPDHLFVGTLADNNADMRQKDRHAHGERSGAARLTDELVHEIRTSYKRGVVGHGYIALAHRFGVSMSTIRSVVGGKTGMLSGMLRGLLRGMLNAPGKSTDCVSISAERCHDR